MHDIRRITQQIEDPQGTQGSIQFGTKKTRWNVSNQKTYGTRSYGMRRMEEEKEEEEEKGINSDGLKHVASRFELD